MIIHSIEEFASEFGSDVKSLKHDMYKYTDCGAWIEWDDKQMQIGSIVEGSDAEFDQTFVFPFEMSEVDIWMEELERLTDEAWQEANGGEDGV